MTGYLVDTDWVIEYLKGREAPTRLLSSLIDRDVLAISVVTFGEVYEGLVARPTDRGPAVIFAEFLRGVTILDIDIDTAELYARLRRTLRAAGTPLPDNDVWNAAVAELNDLTVITSDRHYAHIPNLRIYDAGSGTSDEVTE